MSEHNVNFLRELSDEEYRGHYAEQHLSSSLATQIRTVREQRGYTQERLASKADMHQAAISRIENVNYARWNIGTLKKIASALGCWLDIRLESWGRLVKATEEYSPENLRRDRFEDDSVFFGSQVERGISEPVRWVQQRLFPALGATGGLRVTQDMDELMTNWLQGRNLPPVGDNDPPHVWIVRAIEAEGPDSQPRNLLRGWLAKYLSEALHTAGKLDRPDTYLCGIFSLVAAFNDPMLYWDPLQVLFERELERLSETVRAAFLSALIRNQKSFDLKDMWLKIIERGYHELLPAAEFDAFEGIMWIPARPNVRAVAEGLKAMQLANWDRPEREIDMVLVMRDVRQTFKEYPQLDQLLWREGRDVGWHMPVIKAWEEVFVPSWDEQIRIVEQWSGKPERALSNEFLKSMRKEVKMKAPEENPELNEAMSILQKHFTATAGQQR